MAMTPSGYEQLKGLLKGQLAEWIQVQQHDGQPSVRFDRPRVLTHLSSLLERAQADLRRDRALGPAESQQLLTDIIGELIGLGPLEALLDDASISEIMVNGPHQIFVERAGRIEPVAAAFRDAHHLMSVIERLLEGTGVSVHESQLCVDARLADGSRLNVIVPPIVLNGPTMTIRKQQRQWTMDNFVEIGALTPQVAEFLSACVRARVNLVVSGGTSTGKTTLVSVLSTFIAPEERIITIENVAELELPQREHWLRLVARPANIEGRGEVTLRTLVRNALRMRPDRIILGEARGPEALDVVQAMHTGHEGVITVLHANSPGAALERLETMMLMSGLDLPPEACQQQIVSSVDLVLHMSRYVDGTRRVSSMTQVLGVDQSGFQLQDLFVFDVKGFSPEGAAQGAYRYTGATPKFLSKFQLNNVEVPAWLTTRGAA